MMGRARTLSTILGADGVLNVADIGTGTKDATTFLRGDNSFAVVAVTPTAVSDQGNASTGYFDLPSGTTAQRPGSPAAGMIRHNSSNGFIEYYDTNASQWISFGGVAATGGTTQNYAGFRSHTFTTSGTLAIISGGTIEYAIVAGGGAVVTGMLVVVELEA